MALFLVLEDYTDGRVALAAGDVVSDTEHAMAPLRLAGLVDTPYLAAMDPTIAAFKNRRRQDPLTQNDLLPLLLRSTSGASALNTSTGMSVEARLTGGGFGDVVGPAAATDNAIARYDGVTGKLIQDSAPIVQDDGRITGVTDPTGAQDAATKAYVDALDLGNVPSTRTLTAGAGLTGGGDLSANRTFDVVGNADGSIVANANDVQVGVLATDAQHGVRGGGTQHAAAVAGAPGVNGFITGVNQAKLDALPTSVVGGVLLWGDAGVAATTTTRYLTPGYDAGTALITPVQFRSPVAGTARKLRIRHNTGNGNGNAIVYTLRVNGVASLLSVSIASTANDGSDLANGVAVAAGDLLDIEVTKAASVAATPSEITAVLELIG